MLTIRDRTRREDGLLPLPETGVNALVDQLLGERAFVAFCASALGIQLLPRLVKTLVVVRCVVDVAHLVPRLGPMDRAEIP